MRKGSSGKLENCEKRAVVKTTKTLSDPTDPLANPLNPPVLNLMSSIKHLDLMRALIHRTTLILGSPYRVLRIKTGAQRQRIKERMDTNILISGQGVFFFVSAKYRERRSRVTRIRTRQKGIHVLLLRCIFRKDCVFVYSQCIVPGQQTMTGVTE